MQKQKDIKKLYIIAGILIVGSLFGIIPLATHSIMTLLLGHPADHTTKLAIVNLTTLALTGLSTLVGIILGAIGLIRSVKNTKLKNS